MRTELMDFEKNGEMECILYESMKNVSQCGPHFGFIVQRVLFM